MDTANNSAKKKNDSPTEEEVGRYLRNHPGFFLNNEDILAELKLAHKSGKAVSLLERQVEVLRERNMDMRNRLSPFLENAPHYDQLFAKSQSLIHGLLDASRTEGVSTTWWGWKGRCVG